MVELLFKLGLPFTIRVNITHYNNYYKLRCKFILHNVDNYVSQIDHDVLLDMEATEISFYIH